MDCSLDSVYKWSNCNSINDKPRSGRPIVYDEDIQLKTIAFYCQTTPMPGCGRWSLRWAEKRLEQEPHLVGAPLSHSTIGRILKKHQLKPHLSRYFLHITDPDFFPKMEKIIPLYMNPPKHLYCFDECTSIQILQRLVPDLQTEEMKIRLEEFEYIRNGTMDIFAFLHVPSGKIFSECRAEHKTETINDIFERHLKSLPANEKIHYIMDNLASHASYNMCRLVAKYSKRESPSEEDLDTMSKRRDWLQSEGKRIVFHYTPFHGSWLNMVEIWFGILKQKCLRESFDSPGSIYNAVSAFCEEWNNLLAHPFEWNYDGEGLHQKAVDRFIAILENSFEKLDIDFTMKQFLVMASLIENYPEKVDAGSWLKLEQIINAEIEQFYNIILVDDRPKKKERAEAALLKLRNTLSVHIDKLYRKAA